MFLHQSKAFKPNLTKKPTLHFCSIHPPRKPFFLKDVEQNFPLAAVCINITKMVMDALLMGHLVDLEGDVGKPRTSGSNLNGKRLNTH